MRRTAVCSAGAKVFIEKKYTPPPPALACL